MSFTADKLILFGATGDLSQRMLLPSLCALNADGLVSADLRIIGTARSAHDDASFRVFAGEALERLHNLEELEQRLTALEDKLLAIVRAEQTDEDLFQARKELDSYLRPYRGKMTADQLTMLERQFLDRHLFEKTGLPRLSLFYLR